MGDPHSAVRDQMPQSVASDQGLHCLSVNYTAQQFLGISAGNKMDFQI